MAQPLIKFFRVAKLTDLQATQKVQGGLYFETSTGVLYVYNGTDFEAYSGLKSASFADQKLILTPSVGAAIEIDLSGYVDSTEFNTELANYVKKEQTIAGIDLQDNITAEELKTALGLTSANLAGQANVLEGVKVNGDKLAIDSEKNVDILVTEGATNGTIAVNGKDVAVHGLGSAAYTASTAYDAAGAAATVKAELINKEAEFTDFKAVGDELRALDLAAAGKVADVTVGGTSVVNAEKVAVLGTAAGKSADDFVSSVGYVAYSEAEKTKLEGIEANAEVNIIETVKVNGVALTPDANRAVDVEVPVLGVSDVDEILYLDENKKLNATVALSYGSKSAGGDGYIKLTGKDGAILGRINADEFIKDGMIDSVDWSTEENKENYLVITWNTDAGKQKIEIDFGKYIDTWTHRDAANGIKVENEKYVGVVDKASEAFLTVGEAGFKLAGVQEAINAAVAAKNVSANGDTYVSATVAEGTNTVTVAASESTKASLALADSALQAADITTGTANGTIAVEGVDVAVKGLGDAAYVGTTATPTENSAAAFTAGGAYVLDGKIAANTAAIEEVKDEVSENAQVTAAALTDLNSRLTAAEGTLASGVGVMAVEGEDPYKFASLPAEDQALVQAHDDFVWTEATTDAEGKVTLDSQVVIMKSTEPAKGLATDAYVNERIAAEKISVTSSGKTLDVTQDGNNYNVELAWQMF